MKATVCRALHNAIQKYGRDAFTVEILHEALDIFLDDLEIAEIAKHNTLVPNGYNLDGGGNSSKYRSPETRRKISEAAKGRKRKPLSPEHRQKISEAAKGKKLKRKRFSPEHRLNISEANKDRKHSSETRRKISEANIHPDRTKAVEILNSLPEDMPFKEKYKILRNKFPGRARGTVYNWVKRWSKTSS